MRKTFEYFVMNEKELRESNAMVFLYDLPEIYKKEKFYISLIEQDKIKIVFLSCLKRVWYGNGV
jgi:hypothetical protein